MCNFIKKDNTQCQIISKNDYCHIHERFILKKQNEEKQKEIKKQETENITKLKSEIKNLNKALETKAEKHKKDIKNTEMRYEILLEIKERDISELNQAFNDLKYQLKTQIKLNNKMKEDYDKYQKIKKFENIKNKLIKKNINILEYHDQEFHDLRWERNILAHST